MANMFYAIWNGKEYLKMKFSNYEDAKRYVEYLKERYKKEYTIQLSYFY